MKNTHKYIFIQKSIVTGVSTTQKQEKPSQRKE